MNRKARNGRLLLVAWLGGLIVAVYGLDETNTIVNQADSAPLLPPGTTFQDIRLLP